MMGHEIIIPIIPPNIFLAFRWNQRGENVPAEGISGKGRSASGMSGRSNLSMMGHKASVPPKQFLLFPEIWFQNHVFQ